MEYLTLKSYDYNRYRVMSELAKIVLANGGRVRPCKKVTVANRTISETLKEKQSLLQCWKSVIADSTDTEEILRGIAVIDRTQKEIEKVSAVDNSPIELTHTTHISFVLDDTFYYYQTNDNPFFKFYYIKTPIRNGEYSKDACSENTSKSWVNKNLWSVFYTQEECVSAAKEIFDELVNADCSYIKKDLVYLNVPNVYNDGWHKEKVYKERKGNIDF